MTPRRRLLLVSYHALPSVTPGSLRVQWMAPRLASLGWDVTVLTATQDPVPIQGARVLSVTDRGRALSARLPRHLRALWNEHAVPDRFVTWSRALIPAVRHILESDGADVVLSTSPPHSTQLALARLHRRRPFRWVADFRDPWTHPLRRPRPWLSLLRQRRMEPWVLSRCNAILANTAGNRDALWRAFPALAADRLHVVSNAWDDAVPPRAREAPGEDADITYVGELYLDMAARLIGAMRILHGRDPHAVPRLSFYGEVDPREWQRFEAAGLVPYLTAHGPVSYEASVQAMRRAHSLLVLLPSGDNWASCVPSKVYPYVACGRPVIGLVPEGDTAALLRATGAGVALTATGDDEGTATALGDLVARVRAGAAWEGRREDVVAEYAAAAVTARVHDVLMSVVERSV